MPEKDPEKRFVERIKPRLVEFERFLNEFGTYLLENVALCTRPNWTGEERLFDITDANEIMEYVRNLSEDVGDEEDSKPSHINLAVVEILELDGITSAIEKAIEEDIRVTKRDVMRFFELSARAINFIRYEIEKNGGMDS